MAVLCFGNEIKSNPNFMSYLKLSTHISLRRNGLSMLTTQMGRLLRFSFILILASVSYGRLASQLNDDNLTVYSELEGAKIFDILSDRDGNIWLAAYNGLYRYNGYEFKHFLSDPNDSSSIVSTLTRSLYEDTKGNIWVGCDSYISCYNPVSESFRNYNVNMLEGHPIDWRTVIHSITSQSDGNVYFSGLSPFEGHPAIALMYYSEEDDRIRGYEFHDTIKIRTVYDMAANDRGDLWLVCDSGLFRIEKYGELRKVPIASGGNAGTQMYFVEVEIDRKGVIWLKSDGNALCAYNPADESVQLFSSKDFLGAADQDFILNSFSFDLQDNIWIGTNNGLIYFDRKAGEFEIFHDNSSQALLKSNIENLWVDSFGNIWMGTITNGLVRYTDMTVFQSVRPGINSKGLVSEGSVTHINEMSDGNIWMFIGTINNFEGTVILDPETFELDLYPSETGFYYTNDDLFYGLDSISAFIELTPGKILACRLDGCYLYDIKNKTYEKTNFSDYPKNTFVREIYRDSRDNLWFICWNGLFLKETQKNNIQFFEPGLFPGASLPSDAVSKVYEGKQHGLWIATYNGLFLYDYNTGQVLRHGFDKSTGDVFASQDINSIYEDRNGVVWAGTWDGGLSKYDVDKRRIKTYMVNDGLPSMSIQGILSEEESGILWLSTFDGISRFNTEDEQFNNFNTENGIHGKLFSEGAYLKTSQGHFIFGGNNGITTFRPDDIVKKSIPPIISITSLNIANSSIGSDSVGTVKSDVVGMDEVQLKYNQNNISIDYVGVHYTNSAKNRYMYILENYDHEWREVGNQRSAYYNTLPPGNYTFRVKAANSYGIWSRTGDSIQFEILPPWWRTWWAYTLAGLVVLVLIASLWKYELQRHLTKAEARRLKKLDAVKTKLYTNITHEFRTPLTIISGMADQIAGHQVSKEMIQRNSRKLLRLVNQMLGLAKIEAGNTTLNMIRADVIVFLKYLVESFQSYAQTKRIELSLYQEMDQLVMDFDEEKLQIVVSNLLSNAIKFSPEDSKIVVYVKIELNGNEDKLCIKVKDNGIGIPSKKLSHVFDSFYQVDNSHTRKGEGTGIGLTLTKELVELMGGRITAQSNLDIGSEFTVILPVHYNAPMAEMNMIPEVQSYIPIAENVIDSQVDRLANLEDQDLVLILEDNPDVITYIRACLPKHYRVEVAENGAVGIDKALDLIPDIVISDIMMPIKDGFEVCSTLKNDERTSHIPLILLTAKADIASRIEGLERGADAYLAKPFEKRELLVRLDQLVALRRRLQERYAAGILPAPSSDKGVQMQDAFLQKIRTLIEEHLDDSEFGINELCHSLFLSRMQVHRKLKALTNRSASHVIRSIRLQNAKKLLKTTELTISEIAYDTGFNDPNHFSRVYKEKYGVTPSERR